MDKTSQKLVGFATEFSLDNLSQSARAAATDLVVDTIACAIVGSRSEPASIVARVAKGIQSTPGATVFGAGIKTSPEIAALANAIMTRTYDYNDAYYGHPSDMIPGILAAGEISRSSGLNVLAAIALAYEVYGAFSRSAAYHLDSGVDYGFSMNVGVALAVGKLWNLPAAQLANAASLALIPNLPLGVGRWGALSMMKGSITAFATRNGVFSAMLAKEGFTSAEQPYEGIFGLQHFIGKFDLHLPLDKEKRVVEMVYIKPIPAENNTIGVIELVPKIRAWASVEDIESIDIDVATGLDVHLADEPKYDPKTRETADHSFPYMLARALVDGGITLDSYTPERISDPSIRPLMRKIRVHANPDMKEIMSKSPINQPEFKPARLVVRRKDGGVLTEDVMGHSGHPDTPTHVRRAQINTKLDLCAKRMNVPAEQCERIRDNWWKIAEAEDISRLIGLLSTFRAS